MVCALALFSLKVPQGPERSKGDADLDFYVLVDGEVRPGVEGERLQEGDRVQFTYNAAGREGLVLMSVDGEGQLTVFYPAAGDTPEPIQPGDRHVLADSIELDDAEGPEHFVAVFGAHEVGEARELVEEAFDAGGGQGLADLAEEDPGVDVVRIEKAP